VLRDDQRYCLSCGTRCGPPRLDFTAFWRSPSQAPQPLTPAGTRTQIKLLTPRITIALAAVLLLIGVAAGALIEPAPPNSLAGTERSSLVASSLVTLARVKAEEAQRTTPAQSPETPAAESAPRPIRKRLRHKGAISAASSNEAASQQTNSGEEGQGASPQTQTPVHAPSKSTGSQRAATPVHAPAIHNVWLVDLSQQSFLDALAQGAPDPYLVSLVRQGALLSNYTLTASGALANDVALLSGQGVNPETEQDCPTYSQVTPTTLSPDTDLTEGVGCVYPRTVQTLADQLSTADLSWRAYVQDMAPAQTPGSTTSSNTPPANPAEADSGPTCRHPALGSSEPPSTPTLASDYVGSRNPFVYFDSLLESGACASNDVDLSELPSDLATAADTPNLSWIVPAACHDGAPTPCAQGATSGLATADDFLKEVIPQITASAAYKSSGLIVITFDSAPAAEPGSPPGTPSKVGALLLSPFVKKGARIATSFDVFSLLKSLERLYGVPLLGHAADPQVKQFGDGIYRATETAANAASRQPPTAESQSG
jgi:hypothetical protein